eukprot:470670-Rhodomonas_salina.1
MEAVGGCESNDRTSSRAAGHRGEATTATGSTSWKTKRSKRASRKVQHDYQPINIDQAVARDSLLNAYELSEDRLMVLCSSTQRIRDDYLNSLARSVPTMELVEGMVRNRATITIPDVG